VGPRYRRRPPAPLALSPRPRPRHCSLVNLVPAILVPRPGLLVIVVCSLSLSSFVPPPPPPPVLVAMRSSLLSSPHPCPCFIGVPVPVPVIVVLSWSRFVVLGPWSSFSYPPGSPSSTRDPPCEQGLAAVWRVLGRLRCQHF
jgi:hypothetical protein